MVRKTTAGLVVCWCTVMAVGLVLMAWLARMDVDGRRGAPSRPTLSPHHHRRSHAGQRLRAVSPVTVVMCADGSRWQHALAAINSVCLLL